MSKTEPMTDREVLADLRIIRQCFGRAQAAARLKVIAAMMTEAGSLLADSGGPERLRAQAAQAIVKLSEAYADQSALVPDRLWTEAVNRMYALVGDD